MSTPSTDNSRLIFGSLVFSLGAICLLINLAAVARLVYDVVVLGDLHNLLLNEILLLIVFLFGLGLGTLSQRRFGNLAFSQFARVYSWAYLALACATYLGIVLRISSHNYSIGLFGAFLLIVFFEIITVAGLMLVVSTHNVGLFAIPMLAIVLFHLAVIVYKYVFAGVPLSPYLLGDLIFLLLMTVISSAMLGENAFRSVMEKLIERVG